MRILTGELSGQPILYTKAADLRPTSDKARKALMDMLASRLSGSRVLDLYSGTGALGLEALSGGADHVCFVEQDRLRASQIENNLTRLRLNHQTAILASDASDAIERLAHHGETFDIIFLDPPYDRGIHMKTLGDLFRKHSALLKKGSLVVCEARSRESLEAMGDWEILRHKTYGDTGVWIYAKKNTP